MDQVNGLFIPIMSSLVGAFVTGVVTSYGVLSAMRVHIEYLKDSINSAHKRIDNILGDK